MQRGEQKRFMNASAEETPGIGILSGHQHLDQVCRVGQGGCAGRGGPVRGAVSPRLLPRSEKVSAPGQTRALRGSLKLSE